MKNLLESARHIAIEGSTDTTAPVNPVDDDFNDLMRGLREYFNRGN
jgi:hypothetical protein